MSGSINQLCTALGISVISPVHKVISTYTTQIVIAL